MKFDLPNTCAAVSVELYIKNQDELDSITEKLSEMKAICAGIKVLPIKTESYLAEARFHTDEDSFITLWKTLRLLNIERSKVKEMLGDDNPNIQTAEGESEVKEDTSNDR